MNVIKCPKCDSKDIMTGPTARRRNDNGYTVKMNIDEHLCRQCAYKWVPERMKQNRLTIQINAPIESVFQFTVNPANTPKWISHIVEEQASEWPPVVGTTYRNRIEGGEWSEYIVDEIEENRFFELASKSSSYHVRYTYTEVNSGTELEYFEWMDDGDLDGVFEQSVLVKLKDVIERSL